MICNNPPLLPNITHHLNYFLRNIIHYIFCHNSRVLPCHPRPLPAPTTAAKTVLLGLVWTVLVVFLRLFLVRGYWKEWEGRGRWHLLHMALWLAGQIHTSIQDNTQHLSSRSFQPNHTHTLLTSLITTSCHDTYFTWCFDPQVR